tara:strand:- start:227 stop:442 length:216 start_codon:yes stop_codon:yes gene_type:complete
MGPIYCRVWNICQFNHTKKEVVMPLGLIFAIGGFCSILCLGFFLIHFFEVKRLDENSEYNDPFISSSKEEE